MANGREHQRSGDNHLKTATGDDLTAAPRRSPLQGSVYASARHVTDLSDCYFYHTMDIPGYGHVDGEWNLRDGMRAYLGNVDLRGKRVLEVGTASGFICFQMERDGAEVVAYDLSEEQDWDVVPFARLDAAAFLSARKDHIRRLNNAFWLCHRVFGSSSRMVYGDVYSIPVEIGPVDVATFGSILLHLRDPFLALQKALRLTRETVIVTDMLESDLLDVRAGREEAAPSARGIDGSRPPSVGRNAGFMRAVAKRVARATPVLRDLLADRDRLSREREDLVVQRDQLLEAERLQRDRVQRFLPDWRRSEPRETWWHFSPRAVEEYLGVLGFEDTEVSYHTQKFRNTEHRLFTVVGHRTAELPT